MNYNNNKNGVIENNNLSIPVFNIKIKSTSVSKYAIYINPIHKKIIK